MTQPNLKSLNLLGIYQGCEITLGSSLTVELFNVPLDLFSNVLIRTIEEYPNHDYKNCIILRNEGNDYKIIMIFKTNHLSANQRVCF